MIIISYFYIGILAVFLNALLNWGYDRATWKPAAHWPKVDRVVRMIFYPIHWIFIKVLPNFYDHW